jgi:hypothetical protein
MTIETRTSDVVAAAVIDFPPVSALRAVIPAVT